MIAWTRAFLDEAAPLAAGSHNDVTAYRAEGGALVADLPGGGSPLADPGLFAGYRGDPAAPEAVLLRHNGLHIEIVIDRSHPVGRDDRAGVSDVLLESAVTTIVDCEDSIAAVDAEDKVLAYRNWLGLIKGDLATSFDRDGGAVERRLNPDRRYTGADGAEVVLPGRSLMLCRNVGHLMTNPAVLDGEGREAPEGILDAVFTCLVGLHDLKGTGRTATAGRLHLHRQAQDARPGGSRVREYALRSCRRPSGPRAPSYQDRHHGRGAPHDRQPQGMHPRRGIGSPSINTGFLDRTGDEIHTSMEAGPMIARRT